MSEPQPKENSQKIAPLTFNDLMWTKQNDLRNEVRDTRQELGQRMDRIEKRMDKLEEKIDKLDDKIETVRKEINTNINELRKDIQTSSNHGNIMTASVVGIALAVIYSALK